MPLSYILIGCYLVAFVLSAFTGSDFYQLLGNQAVSTGPIMVPLVMALGLGLAAIRGDKTSEEDSFGLISLCLIGPIISVLILGMFFTPSGGSVLYIPLIQRFFDILSLYFANLPEYFKQVAVALFPIITVFAIMQVASLRLKTKDLLKISAGTIYTYFGLVLFLLSVNVGFMPAGYELGRVLTASNHWSFLILVGLVMGYFVVAAEPAVFVLKRQVEEVTAGVISAKAMEIGLSVGVGISVALSMIRVVTGISILYFVVPGYVLAEC